MICLDFDPCTPPPPILGSYFLERGGDKTQRMIVHCHKFLSLFFANFYTVNCFVKEVLIIGFSELVREGSDTLIVGCADRS